MNFIQINIKLDWNLEIEILLKKIHLQIILKQINL